VQVREKQKARGLDLSGYTYSQLRLTINSTSDPELAEACKEEFHRRLKCYHLWKKRQQAAMSNPAIKVVRRNIFN